MIDCHFSENLAERRAVLADGSPDRLRVVWVLHAAVVPYGASGESA